MTSWTTVEAVCREVPGFRASTRITEDHVAAWIASAATTIAAAMMRRGLSLDAGVWPAGALAPADVLEAINRAGAAARLAAAIASDFTSSEWGLAKSLSKQFADEIGRIDDGGYDRVFNAGAATVEGGPLFAGGDIEAESGASEAAFTKEMKF